MSVNRVILVGRLGKDPEIRTTNSDQKVANFSVATDETYKKDGEKIKRTEWHRIVIWGKLADIVEQYLTKGSLVYLEGRIQTRKWEDKEGAERYSTDIVCDTMRMLGGGEKEEERPAAKPKSTKKTTTKRESQTEEPYEATDEDIPF